MSAQPLLPPEAASASPPRIPGRRAPLRYATIALKVETAMTMSATMAICRRVMVSAIFARPPRALRRKPMRADSHPRLFRAGRHDLLPPSHFLAGAKIGLSGPYPRSIPERTHEGRRRLEPLFGQRAHEALERRPVLRIHVVMTGHCNVIRSKNQITAAVALHVLLEDSRPQVGFVHGRLGLQSPVVSEVIHHFTLESRVDAGLAGELAVVVLDGVQRLGQVAGVVRRKDGGVIRLREASAPEVVRQQVDVALDLPDRIPVFELRRRGRLVLVDELLS